MALNLNKLFVRVTGNVSVSDVLTQSTQTGNHKKVYFIEGTKQIVNNGIVYGVDPSTVSSISDLQALIGAEKISDTSAFGKSVIARLQALEAITVASDSTDYLTVTLDSSVPTIAAKIVDIEDAVDSQSTGLLDAASAKAYIDEQVAEAKTVVTAGKGIDVDTSTAASDGHTIYTIDSSLTLEYHAAVTTVGSEAPATITLTGANGGNFGTINISDIIGNGVISGTDYDPATGTLTLTFNKADGTTQDVDIDLQEMLDLGDLMVASGSEDYLTISTVSGETDTNQASFALNVIDISTAAANNTGLVDAWDLKEYIRTQTSDLTVRAEGDDYVSASIDENDNKKVVVETNVEDLTVTGGTAAAYGSDFIPTGNATHGTLSGEEGALADASDIATAVKTYVDGEIAIESARTDASLNYRISILDADVSTKGTNVSVGVTEVNGVITAVNVTEDYATISYVAATDTWTNTNPTGLVTGNDMNTMKSYVDDKVADSEISAEGDGKYIDASVDGTDKKKINVAAVTDNMVYTGGNAGTAATLTGTANTLVDGAQAATAISQYVEDRLTAVVDGLDGTATVTDSSSYVTATIAEDNGVLTNTGSSMSVTYGTMGVTATGGIAKAEDVQDFVDHYDFWEDYTPSNNG